MDYTNNEDPEVDNVENIDGINIWGITGLPSFTSIKAFILAGAFYRETINLFKEAGFDIADSVEEADVVVFIGGADVNPVLYGETPLKYTQAPSIARDALEIEVYNKCIAENKVMFGICRGAQFLHVMNGGTLWQHVEGHGGMSHYIYDIEDDCLVMATSIHHQMLTINNDINIIACCKDQVSTKFHSDKMVLDLNKEKPTGNAEIEIEAGSYIKTGCFFVQGHPEIGTDEYKSWTFHKFWDFLEELTIEDEKVSPLAA